MRLIQALGILAIAWCVGCSGSKAPAPVPVADPVALLNQNRDAMFGLKSYSAVCLVERTFDPPKSNHLYGYSKLTAEKPTKMRYDSWAVKTLPTDPKLVPPTRTPDITFASDGSQEYQQFGKFYRKAPDLEPEMLQTILEPWDGFYAKGTSTVALIDQARDAGGTAEVTYAGQDKVDGSLCDKVQVHKISTYEGQTVDYAQTYFIGHDDHLTRRLVEHVSFDGKPGFTTDSTLRNIDTNGTVVASIYKYTPPAGVELQKVRAEPALLAKGSAAPNFEALDAAKKSVHLSDLRGSVVVIDFWASWCGPCRASMPHTEEVIKKLAGSGMKVIALAVDNGEPREPFESWVAENKATYPTLRFVHVDPSANPLSSKLYKVTGIPTQYIVDKHGKISASFVGYGGPTDDLENAIRDANKG